MSDWNDIPPRNMRASARGQGRAYQAGRDISFPGNHQHHHDYDQGPFQAFFTGRGPGRMLIVVGLVVALVGFTGWASIVFGFSRADVSGPEDLLGDRLPSGVPIGIVYFLGFGAGGILMSVGSSMAKAAVHGGSRVGHLLITVVVVLGTGLGLVKVLAGADWSALVPRFSAAAGTGQAEVVSATAKSATKGGLTLTVTGIENVGGKGRVHLRVVNKNDHSLSLPVQFFALTDAAGRTYEPNWSGGDWRTDVGAGATQVGVIQLKKVVPPGSGPLRAEFTTVFGPGGKAIAVTGIPTR